MIRGIYVCGDITAAPPALLFAHGLGSTRQGEKAAALEAECARRGWAFVAFDFHGHGESDGTMLDLRGSRLLADLDAITQFVAEREHHNIFLVGSSLGGWAAAWFAALHPQRVQACALIAPAFRFLEWRRLNAAARKLWQRTGRLHIVNEWIDLELAYGLHAESDEYRFEQLCACFATPCLIFHGLQDDTVPSATSLEFTEQCAAADVQLQLLKNGDHRLNAHKDWLAQVACDFFAARI
jgi:pimeloyl-ACP methyl ester carboxylesterase